MFKVFPKAYSPPGPSGLAAVCGRHFEILPQKTALSTWIFHPQILLSFCIPVRRVSSNPHLQQKNRFWPTPADEGERSVVWGPNGGDMHPVFWSKTVNLSRNWGCSGGVLEVNGSAYAFTVNTSHYLQVLLKMSLCLLLIKVRVTTSTFSGACTHTNTENHSPLQKRIEQMLRNLRFKRELGLPPHLHSDTHVPHLAVTPFTHAPTTNFTHNNLKVYCLRLCVDGQRTHKHTHASHPPSRLAPL